MKGSVPLGIHNDLTQGIMTLRWPGGLISTFTHIQLRALCSCSACRAGRLQGRLTLVDARVKIAAVNPQLYGVQLVFDDGHQRGIYPWSYLWELGNENPENAVVASLDVLKPSESVTPL